MKIGIAGPISTSPLRGYLDEGIAVPPSGLGGSCVVQLVKSLLAKGHSVSVYSLDLGVKEPVVLKGKLLTLYYGTYRQNRRMRDFMRVEREGIRNFIDLDKPDVVNAHWTYEFALAALASRRPTLVTVHDWAPAVLMHNPTLYRFGRTLMNYRTILRGSHFSAISPYIREHLQQYTRNPIDLLPNFLDDEEFFPGSKSLNLRDPLIISLNNGFGTRKNVRVLLHAFKLIREALPTCRLLLVGHDYEQNGLASCWAEENGLEKGIEFVGYTEHCEAQKLLEQADLLIHPSLEESFGLTLLEAMAKRIPVIGGRRSGAVPWLLDYGQAGVLLNIQAPESIATESIKLLTDRDLWSHYSLSGYKQAWTHFRSSQVVGRYIERYRGLGRGGQETD